MKDLKEISIESFYGKETRPGGDESDDKKHYNLTNLILKHSTQKKEIFLSILLSSLMNKSQEIILHQFQIISYKDSN